MTRLASFVPLMVLASGCAFGTRHVNLAYPAASPVSSGASGHVAVAPFSDARTPDIAVGRQIGQVRNGWGIPTASVETSQDPARWVTDGLARGLMAHGFAVERVDAPAAAGDLPVVTGSVEEVFADIGFSVNSEVKARIAVQRSGQKLLETQCVGQGSKMGSTASASDYGESFASAIHQFVENCVPRIQSGLGDSP